MVSLQHKVVVLTGAANGLGKALATEFYRMGCHLALIDIDLAGLQKVKDELPNEGQVITIHQADVSKDEDIAATRLNIVNVHQHVDILINNAGISISRHFEQVELADYKNLFDTNFWGTVSATKHFLPDLKQRQHSQLVNITSSFALIGFPGKTAYCSSKSAITGFTNALQTELVNTPVSVCLVIPPPLDTGIVRSGKHINDRKRENEARFLAKKGMPIDKAARRIVRGIQKGKYRIIIGAMTFWTDLAARLFPTILHRLIGKYKKRIDFV